MLKQELLKSQVSRTFHHVDSPKKPKKKKNRQPQAKIQNGAQVQLTAQASLCFIIVSLKACWEHDFTVSVHVVTLQKLRVSHQHPLTCFTSALSTRVLRLTFHWMTFTST